MKNKFIFIILLLLSSTASAQYYNTLPKGVRLVMARHIKSSIESSYNRTQSETPYAFKLEANIANLKQIDNEIVQDALALFSPYPEAYDKLSLGTHTLKADAEVSVDVYGFGYGITDRVTAYFGAPIYDATVKVKYNRLANSSHKEVAEILQKEHGDDWAQTLGNIVENFYDIDENILQSALVNSLGYDELGTWRGKGLGDIEFGVMYNFLREDKYGLMATFGGVAPTGYVDDPDLLQDIGFGDGQWDAFFELGGGYILSPSFTLNAWARYTHQFESDKELRVPYSDDVFLSDLKGRFTEKLGNNLKFGFNTDIKLNDWLTLQPHYIYSFTEKAKYDSSNTLANNLLAEDSESYFHNFRMQAEISTVNLYLKKKFLLPAKVKFAVQTMLEGRNTPKADLAEVEFNMFF